MEDDAPPASPRLPAPRDGDEHRALDETTMKLPLYVRPAPAEEGYIVDAAPLAYRVQEQLREVSFFSGPIPSPETLAAYDEVVPGCARELVDMLLNEQRHRMAVDHRVLNTADRQQWLTFTFIITIAVFALVLALAGDEAAAIAFMSADVLGAGANLAVRRLRRRRRDRRDEESKPADD